MCVLWYIFAGQVLFRSYALRQIRLQSFVVNSELMQQDGREKKAVNLM